MDAICCPDCKGPLTLHEWGSYYDTSTVEADGTTTLNATGIDEREGYKVVCAECDADVPGFEWEDGKVVRASTTAAVNR